MASVLRRLEVLEAAVPSPPIRDPGPPLDLSRLTLAEQAELEDLLSHVRWGDGGRIDFDALDNDAFDRLEGLMRQGWGLDPRPPWPAGRAASKRQ